MTSSSLKRAIKHANNGGGAPIKTHWLAVGSGKTKDNWPCKHADEYKGDVLYSVCCIQGVTVRAAGRKYFSCGFRTVDENQEREDNRKYRVLLR